MTRREIMNTITETLANGNTTISAEFASELLTFAEKELASLDKESARRKTTMTKTQKANAEFKKQILKYIGEQEKPLTCTEIAANFNAFSVQKVSAMLYQLTEEGALTKGEGTKENGKKAVYSISEQES